MAITPPAGTQDFAGVSPVHADKVNGPSDTVLFASNGGIVGMVMNSDSSFLRRPSEIPVPAGEH